jgi:hypothetical protein
MDVLVGVGDFVLVGPWMVVCDGAPVGVSEASSERDAGVNEVAGEQAPNTITTNNKYNNRAFRL